MWFWRAYLCLLALLTLSGLLLMFLYVPSAAPVQAAPAVHQGITPAYVFRGIHFWCAQLVIIAILAHLGRAFFVKTNRRRAGWIIDLAALTSLLWFTGMLLPWDELGDWLNRSGLHLTLLQIYILHVLPLPLFLYALAAGYVWRIRKDKMTPTTIA